MKAETLLYRINITAQCTTPKYKQLANAILTEIKTKRIHTGDILPSINVLSTHLHISRQTAEKAYRYLKSLRVILPIVGKGFIVHDAVGGKIRVAVVLNRLTTAKKTMYNTFEREMGDRAQIDLYIYHGDLATLRSMLINNATEYDYVAVFPGFRDPDNVMEDILRIIPAEKRIILGKYMAEMHDSFASIYENHEEDIVNALEQLTDKLRKYHTIKLIYPDFSDYPRSIIKGFYRYAQEQGFHHSLVESLQCEKIEKGTCYIQIAEEDLVELLDLIVTQGLKLGKDTGVISYNETPLKKYVMNGITTISADFDFLGSSVAKCIIDSVPLHLHVPFGVAVRHSI